MVAERYLSALLLEIAPPPAREAMAAELLRHMSWAGEIFVPTMIADHPDPNEVVEGTVMLQMTWQALPAGQALMSVGGYIVRGMLKSRGPRAIAIRRPNGAFEMVPVEYYTVAGREFARPLPFMNHADDLASAASSICLAIQDIQGTPSPPGNLLPALESTGGIGEPCRCIRIALPREARAVGAGTATATAAAAAAATAAHTTTGTTIEV